MMRALALLLTLSSAIPASAQSVAEQKRTWEQRQKDDRAFIKQLFQESGFSPPEPMREARTQVRQFRLNDPYFILPVPGIQITRTTGGQVSAIIQYNGYVSASITLGAADWRTLAAREAAVFAPARFQPARAVIQGAPTPPPPMCHAWSVYVRTENERSGGWSGCSKSSPGTYAYVVAAIEAVMRAKPACSYGSADPFWSFQRCYGPTSKLDDPALDATYTQLLKEYSELPGAARLAEARMALAKPDLSLGSPDWLAAREAVSKAVAINDRRHDLLSRLHQLAGKARNTTPADRVKLSNTILAWNSFLLSQHRNNEDLLRRLVESAQK